MNNRHSWKRIISSIKGNDLVKIDQCKNCCLLRITKMRGLGHIDWRSFKKDSSPKIIRASSNYFIFDNQLNSAKSYNCESIQLLKDENKLLKDKNILIRILKNGDKLIL